MRGMTRGLFRHGWGTKISNTLTGGAHGWPWGPAVVAVAVVPVAAVPVGSVCTITTHRRCSATRRTRRRAFATALERRGPTVIDAVIDREAIAPVTRYDKVRDREL